MRRSFAALVFAFALASAACGDGEEGDSCQKEGQLQGECATGLVCARRDPSDSLVCVKQCVQSAQCGPGEECGGPTGKVLGCRKKRPIDAGQ